MNARITQDSISEPSQTINMYRKRNLLRLLSLNVLFSLSCTTAMASIPLAEASSAAVSSSSAEASSAEVSSGSTETSNTSTEALNTAGIKGSVTQNEVSAGASTTSMDGSAPEHAKTDAAPINRSGITATVNGSATLTPSPQTPLQGKVIRKRAGELELFPRRWTSEDYRSLNYGILGLVTMRWTFCKTEKVMRLVPNCPAVLAGIKPGDEVVQIADQVLDGHDTQRIAWHTADGVAGTHVDYTVRRHGQLIKFDLIRMNIEDIQDQHIRGFYEHLLRKFGPPGSVDIKKLYRQPSE